MSHQAGRESGAKQVTDQAYEMAVDVTLTTPTVESSPGEHAARETKRIEWKNVQLEFDQVDGDGYGYAHDPYTSERFMLAVSTVGGPMNVLRRGQKFVARVTKAHYVTQILSVAG